MLIEYLDIVYAGQRENSLVFKLIGGDTVNISEQDSFNKYGKQA